ncbi:GNAT family N-acetyltransferase [Tissierella pigra]|uniref:GNAT family N-acetyltransferase n=1 Tax=Tissierella pigra TaxID=2607614 RepID=A0A6N7XFV2_9FIRM|nr:N-acetyltransferase [Tissierella pigra]MBU5425578.1 GNAT family N-acetyltransferase [Tissierella pigra]MSU00869.1 GNAT family N-acetyltransferase [Tissierella pigra]
MNINIRKAEEKDFEDIWNIFKDVVVKGDTYVFSPNSSEEVAYDYWFGNKVISYVAECDGKILGMYKLIANQPDLGSHVSNASFMVSSESRGKGLGRLMGEHCLKEAKKAGFKAMQFNFVISTNTKAVNLWKGLGFEIVGTLPKAYRHLELGYVDVYVMFRDLDDIEV